MVSKDIISEFAREYPLALSPEVQGSISNRFKCGTREAALIGIFCYSFYSWDKGALIKRDPDEDLGSVGNLEAFVSQDPAVNAFRVALARNLESVGCDAGNAEKIVSEAAKRVFPEIQEKREQIAAAVIESVKLPGKIPESVMLPKDNSPLWLVPLRVNDSEVLSLAKELCELMLSVRCSSPDCIEAKKWFKKCLSCLKKTSKA